MAGSHARQALAVLGVALGLCWHSILPASGNELKLSGAPLEKVFELYSLETGHNVFVDEAVQQSRKVHAHLQDMSIEQAFSIIQKNYGA